MLSLKMKQPINISVFLVKLKTELEHMYGIGIVQ